MLFVPTIKWQLYKNLYFLEHHKNVISALASCLKETLSKHFTKYLPF